MKYFKQVAQGQHIIELSYVPERDEKAIELALARKEGSNRKKTVKEKVESSAERLETGEERPTAFICGQDKVALKDFFEIDVMESAGQIAVARLPHFADGLCLLQRKIFYTAMVIGAGVTTDLEVFAGKIKENTGYTGRNLCLSSAATRMDSAKFKIIQVKGHAQFQEHNTSQGKRRSKCSDPHYLSVTLSSVAQLLFPPEDSALWQYSCPNEFEVKTFI